MGCLTSVVGVASGGMIGVFVAKIVGSIRGCVPPPGPPACDAGMYWTIGAALGVLTLPALVLWRLRRGDAASDNSERG